MEDFSSLIIPTFYVNSVVMVVQIGPCLKIYQGQRSFRQAGPVIPELATIWPVADLAASMVPMWETLHSVEATPSYARLMS